MPRHKHVTTCLHGGPISSYCGCYHCTLSVCDVCGCYEGSLTTDCPGEVVSHDRQQEIYETPLDYTDERGWHLSEQTFRDRTPRFEETVVPPEAPRADMRREVARAIDWKVVDAAGEIQAALTQRAIAWALADQRCEDRAIALARSEDATLTLRQRHGAHLNNPGEHGSFTAEEETQIAQHELLRASFHEASALADACQEELHQTARVLVKALKRAAPPFKCERCHDRHAIITPTGTVPCTCAKDALA